MLHRRENIFYWVFCFLFFQVEFLTLSVNVFFERLCLWVLRNFRIIAYSKSHMWFSSGEAMFITTIHVCTSTFQNLQKLWSNNNDIMEDNANKWNAICISLGLALCILKSVGWWAHWLMNENWALKSSISFSWACIWNTWNFQIRALHRRKLRQSQQRWCCF